MPTQSAGVFLYNEIMTQQPTEASSSANSSTHSPTKPHKNVQGVQREVLYTGKRVQREIQYVRVHNHRTGDFHHDSIALKTYRKSAKTDWTLDEKASISLSENHDGELTRALEFVARCRGVESETPPAQTSDLTVAEACEHLLQSPLKQSLAELLRLPTQHLQHAQLLWNVATYRKALKGLQHLLKEAQSSERLFTFFQAYPELLLQSGSPLYTGELPPNTLGYIHPLTRQLQWVVLAPYTQAPLFQLNTQCSTWIPGEVLSTALGELNYELRSLRFEQTPEILILVGNTADAEQESALALFGQGQRYRLMSYSQLFKQSTRHLKGLQEQLKQLAPQV